MLLVSCLLSLVLLASRSQAAVVAHRATSSLSLPSSTKPPAPEKTAVAKEIPLPTNALSQRFLKPRGGPPSGVVEVGLYIAAACSTRNGTVVISTNSAKPTGLMWMPSIPFDDPGQIVYVGTDTDGIVFENVLFSAPPSYLDPYTSLLTAYSNSSGWSMTMPATAPANITCAFYSTPDSLSTLTLSNEMQYRLADHHLDSYWGGRNVILQCIDDSCCKLRIR